MSKTKSPKVFTANYSYVGIIVGVVFFFLSLTPSLLPREVAFQGLVSGISSIIGYGLGVLISWTWRYLKLPEPNKVNRRKIKNILLFVGIALGALVFWQYVGWQNTVRSLVGSEPLASGSFIIILVINEVVAGLILIAARSIRKLSYMFSRWINKIMPPRTSRVLGSVVAVLLIFFIVDGVVLKNLYDGVNQAFSVRDTTTDEGVNQPNVSQRSGSEDSLVPWDTLGRQGRNFIGGGPSLDDLNNYHSGGAIEPIRLYAGIKSADTVEGRAQLMLDELIRTKAFDREMLLVVTTTGTGWLDPKAIDPLEYMYKGDSAVVGVQYSYLPSWISILVDQEKSKETSIVVFEKIYDYWKALPESERPELYIYGLSLGSFGAESIIQSTLMINDPINGALLAGPPFVNDLWSQYVDDRDEGSPAWQPIYRDGELIRFTAKENALNNPTAEWGHTKVVYTQHATDPVVFFSPGLAFREPDWLKDGERGPDVTPDMKWYPFVTMWQVAGDLPTAGAVTNGHGHNYAPDSNVDTWAALTEPSNWTQNDTDKLAEFFKDR